MKFNKIGQVSLVSAIALILASAFTACNPVDIDYLFVAGNKQNPGQIQTFVVDRESGALSTRGAAVSSGGVMPVALVTTPNYSHLFAANQGDSSIVEFTISGSGTLTLAKSVTLSSEGNTPVSLAVNNAGTLLYVLNAYQPNCSKAVTGASSCNGGALAVFPIGADGSLGTPVANGSLAYWPIGVNPTQVNALSTGAAVFITSYDPGASQGYVYGFSATSAGALTPVPAVSAGVKPVALASDPTGRFVYVTDFAQNQMIAYTVLSGSQLKPLINGPFRTGNQPSSIQVDARGKYIYVSNQLDNSVSAYSIDLSTGTPSAAVNATGSGTNSTGTQPVSLLIDPGFARFVYTANFLDNSVSGFQLNASTGTLSSTLSGPYPTVGQPSALASVPHGNHSIQVNQP